MTTTTEVSGTAARRVAALTVALLGVALAAPVAADTTLTFNSAKGQKEVSMYISHGQVRMEPAADVQDGMVTLYDGATNTVTVLNRKEHSYLRMDEAAFKRQADMVGHYRQQAMAQMQEQLKSMPPEQRKMMEQRMAQMGMAPGAAAAPAPRMRIVASGAHRDVKGVSCAVYKAYRGDEEMGESCVAHPDALHIPAADYATLHKMMGFMEKVGHMMGKAAGRADDGMNLMAGVDGVPVSYRGPHDGDSGVLDKVSTGSLSADLFKVPAGYHEQEMPMGGQP